MELTYKDVIIASNSGLINMMHKADIRNRIDAALWYLEVESNIEEAIKLYNSLLKNLVESYTSFIKKDKDGKIIYNHSGNPFFNNEDEEIRFSCDIEEIQNKVAFNIEEIEFDKIKNDISNISALKIIKKITT